MLYVITKSKKVKENILLLWLAICILMYFVPVRGIIGSILNIVLMPKYISTFIIGICIREYVSNRVDKRNMVLLILAICNLFIWSSILTIAFTSGSAILILLFVIYNFKINGNRIIVKSLCYIASISYPLYLCHQMIGYAIIYHLQKIGLRREYFIMLPIIVSVILATIVHNIVEERILKYIL